MIQFTQFAVVGLLGFVVDTTVVYALRSWAGLYLAGCVSFAAAVSVTWWVNRIWTFRGRARAQPAHRQWVRYAIANTPGMILNRAAYFLLVTFSPLCAQHPILAVAAGAIAGMFANFILSRSIVFR